MKVRSKLFKLQGGLRTYRKMNILMKNKKEFNRIMIVRLVLWTVEIYTIDQIGVIAFLRPSIVRISLRSILAPVTN